MVVTAETATMQEGAGQPPAPADRPPRHPLWRLVGSTCALVPLVVLAPLVTQAPDADHKFNIYAYGSMYAQRPWRLPVDVLRAVPQFLQLGNFRPLGRIYEWSLDVAVFGMADLLGLPANIGLRLLGFAAAVVMTLAAVLLAESVVARGRPFAGAPPVPVALLPFAIGGCLVAAGPASTTTLFTGLYFSTGALVLAAAAWACRAAGAGRLGARRGLLAVLGGAALAGFNEMACLAVPLATVAVLVRSVFVLGYPWRVLGRDAGIRFVLLLWAGFLPVFLPVRAIIQANCADGSCYDGSEIALPGAPATLPYRLTSWLPPLGWHWATTGGDGWLSGPWPVLASALLLIPAARLLRAMPRMSTLDRAQALAMATVGATVLVLGAATGSLNIWMQRHAALGHWGVGWRDSVLTTAGGATLTLALVAVVAGRWRRAAAVVLAVLVLTAVASAAANRAYHRRSAELPSPYLHDRIAQELADFDPTPAGNTRRCALRAEFVASSPGNRPRIDQILDLAAGSIAHRPFCMSR
jgi:hypothetical protein